MTSSPLKPLLTSSRMLACIKMHAMICSSPRYFVDPRLITEATSAMRWPHTSSALRLNRWRFSSILAFNAPRFGGWTAIEGQFGFLHAYSGEPKLDGFDARLGVTYMILQTANRRGRQRLVAQVCSELPSVSLHVRRASFGWKVSAMTTSPLD